MLRVLTCLFIALFLSISAVSLSFASEINGKAVQNSLTSSENKLNSNRSATDSDKKSDKKDLAIDVAKDSDEDNSWKFAAVSRNLAVFSSIFGPGASLASLYDFSIYNSSMYKSIKVSNGTGISMNSKYPLVSGSAFTSETALSGAYKLNSNLTAGFSLNLYANLDSDDVNLPGEPIQRLSRVYGVNIPSGNWTSLQSAPYLESSKIPGLFLALDKIYVKGESERSNWALEAGSLYPSLGKKYNKYINVNYFLLRYPVSQMSAFGHLSSLDSIYSGFDEEESTPSYGVRFSGKSNDFYYEAFSCAVDESPVSVGEFFRYSGLTLGLASENLRLGLSFAHCFGGLLGEEAEEAQANTCRQDVFGLNGEYDFSDCFGAFFMMGTTDYNQNGALDGHRYAGRAFYGGASLHSADKRSQFKVSWQHVSPDYDPLGFHKASIFHNNYEGCKFEALKYWGTEEEREKERNKFAISYSDLSQIETDIGNPDFKYKYIYGDYFFPDGGVGARGKVTVLAPSLNVYFRNLKLSVGAEYEKMRLFRSEDYLGSEYLKNVDNYSFWAAYDIDKHWNVAAGYREVNFGGEWSVDEENIPYLQKVSIPKIQICYKNENYSKINLQAQFLDFKDMTPFVPLASENDWHGAVLLLETSLMF